MRCPWYVYPGICASSRSDYVQIDTVGNVEAGILAASWSPDDSLLVLATGVPRILVLRQCPILMSAH